MSRAMMVCGPRKEPVMRHDPAGAALIIMLRSLKMPGMAQAVQDLHEQGSPAFEAAMPILSQLLKAEMAEREVRSIAYHMKAARFPAYKDLSAFDFAASEMREALVRQLHRCEFLDGAENVVLIHCPAGYCAAMHERGRPWHREIACCDSPRHSGNRASPQARALLLDGRTGQRAGAGKSPRQGREDRRSAGENRLGGPRRVGILAVQRLWRCLALPPP